MEQDITYEIALAKYLAASLIIADRLDERDPINELGNFQHAVYFDGGHVVGHVDKQAFKYGHPLWGDFQWDKIIPSVYSEDIASSMREYLTDYVFRLLEQETPFGPDEYDPSIYGPYTDKRQRMVGTP